MALLCLGVLRLMSCLVLLTVAFSSAVYADELSYSELPYMDWGYSSDMNIEDVPELEDDVDVGADSGVESFYDADKLDTPRDVESFYDADEFDTPPDIESDIAELLFAVRYDLHVIRLLMSAFVVYEVFKVLMRFVGSWLFGGV